VLTAHGQTGAVGSATSLEGEIERLLTGPQLAIGDVEILSQPVLLDAYRDNGFESFWGEVSRIEELLAMIGNAGEHGLDSRDYAEHAIAQILSEPAGPDQWELAARRDILLSESLFRYGYHRRLGKIKASSLDPDINYRRDSWKNQPVARNFRQSLQAPSLGAFIEGIASSGPVYKSLQAGLARYRLIAAANGWPTVPQGPTLRPGDRDPRVSAVRHRLSVSGEFTPPPNDPQDLFDPALKEAVQRFQRHHGLEPDGIVGKQTVAALNVSVEQRIDQLRLSLERLRWVNQEVTDTLIAVNIAGFRAFYVRNGAIVWEARAMVGRPYRKTPTFRSDLVYMEFNPTWTIPPTILRNDTLPAIRRDPGYLARNHIVLLDYGGDSIDPATVDWAQYTSSVPFLLRQLPGPDNALGRVKFIFPNPHAVFLHDTPHQELFNHPERAFSSGCIRIEHPLQLAALLLEDASDPPLPDLAGLVQSGETRRIYLTRPIPVIIVYLTASVDDDGSLLFYKDIYNRDEAALDALNGPVVLDPPASA